MLPIKILIGKLVGSIDSRTSCAISIFEVSTLQHEIFDDAVELAAFVAQRFAQVVFSLARAELAEVFSGAGDNVGEEFHLDAA